MKFILRSALRSLQPTHPLSYELATQRLVNLITLMLVMIVTGGCLSSRMSSNSKSFLGRQQSVLDPEAELIEIVEHLNRRCYQVQGWQSTDATVHISGLPVPLKAMIAVEEPQQARLIVSNPLGQHEFQAGSNEAGIWSWEKRDEDKKIITVSHEEVPQLILENGIPFSPEWLMQIVGLTPFDAARLKLERTSKDPHTIKLIEMVSMPDGTLKKETLVDLRQGVVTGHDLYDPRGTWLVSARISDYRKTDVEGIIMPVEYQLRIPNARQGMTIKLATLEVNPDFSSRNLWAVPHIEDCRVVAMHPRGSALPSIPSRRSRDQLDDGIYQQKMAWEYDLTDPKNPKTKHHVIGLGEPEIPAVVRTAQGSAGTAEFDLLTQEASAPDPQSWPATSPASQSTDSMFSPSTSTSAPAESDIPEWAR